MNFASYLESGFDVVSQLLPLHRNVIFGQPVGEEDGSAQSFLLVHVREMSESDGVNVIIRPFPLIVCYQPSRVKGKCSIGLVVVAEWLGCYGEGRGEKGRKEGKRG